MFNKKSFEVFKIDGLEARMAAIRAEIQPIFQEIGEQLLTKLSASQPDEKFYLHIAQHRRRTANAPENTWAAISTKSHGYKMEAHFQLGIWADYVFVYLSIIDQPKMQKAYTDKLLHAQSLLTDLSADFVLSKDHTKVEIFPFVELPKAIERLATVKKSELEIGRIWAREKFDEQHDEEILKEMLGTIEQLFPVYKKLMDIEGADQ